LEPSGIPCDQGWAVEQRTAPGEHDAVVMEAVERLRLSGEATRHVSPHQVELRDEYLLGPRTRQSPCGSGSNNVRET